MIRTLTILLFLLPFFGNSQTPNARCANPVLLNRDSMNLINLSSYLFPVTLLMDGNTATSPVPTSGEKFDDYVHRTRGWRWDDDLRQSYYITDIRVYWGTSSGDTFNVWISDSVFNGGPAAFARIRNINSTTWDIISYSPGSAGWVNYPVDDSARYIRFQFKNAWFAGNPFPSDGVREVEIYGCRIGSPVPIFATKRAPIPIGEKDGTNIAGAISPIVTNFKNKKYIRTYPQRNWTDDQNVAYPSNLYNADFFTGNPYPYNDSVKNDMGIFFWPALLGTNQYVISTGGKAMEYMAVDAVGNDPEDPASYERDADMAWNFAAMFGNGINPAVDTPFMRIHNYAHLNGGRKIYNMNNISGIEPDNERNGWWKFFGLNQSPIADVARSSMFKDGDQGRYLDHLGGNRMGMKNADANLAFIMDGTAGIDIEIVKARCYLSMMLRGELMWDWVQVHEYFSLYDGAVTFTSSGQIGNRGTYPEDDSARIRYDLVPYWVYRIAGDTTALIMTGEHGKDASRTYPQTLEQVSANYTQYGACFYVDGSPLDSFQSQALDIEIDKVEIWASGLQAGVQYLFHDLEIKTNPGYLAAYVSSGYIEHGGAYKPAWARIQSQMNLMDGYLFGGVLSYVNGGLVHYWGYKPGTDSILNYIRKADDSTGAGVAVSIDVGDATGYELRQASFTSENFTSSSGSPSGGVINATATIIPKYYFTLQSEAPSNVPPDADAGPDQTVIGAAVLFGAGSSDPDGTIASYLWEKVSGPDRYTILLPNSANTLVMNLDIGTYVFRLTITDNDGATDSDTVVITVGARARRTYKVINQ